MTDENEEDDDSDEAYDANNNYQSRVARAFAPYSDMVLEQVGGRHTMVGVGRIALTWALLAHPPRSC